MTRNPPSPDAFAMFDLPDEQINSVADRKRRLAAQRGEAMRHCELRKVAVTLDGIRRSWTTAERQARYRARKVKAQIDSLMTKRRVVNVTSDAPSPVAPLSTPDARPAAPAVPAYVDPLLAELASLKTGE